VLGNSQRVELRHIQEQLTGTVGAKASTSSGYSTRDMLYVVMEQCKCAEKKDVFVRDVTCAPEPMAVLCTDQQLFDMSRFCCDSYDFCILGIDPTFNLGEFSVTPTVYKHLLVYNPRTSHSPLLLGPILVHYHKHFRSYNYFLSTLVGLKREIADINAVGTDGEKNLVDAVLRNFPHVAHVRCFRHLQQNIELHLRNERSTLRIFLVGNEADGTYHEGRFSGDCCDISTFDAKLEILKTKWNQLEKT